MASDPELLTPIPSPVTEFDAFDDAVRVYPMYPVAIMMIIIETSTNTSALIHYTRTDSWAHYAIENLVIVCVVIFVAVEETDLSHKLCNSQRSRDFVDAKAEC